MNHLDESTTWSEYSSLDKRILKALSKLGYTYPTLVQSKCIPLALLGKDVLVRARTGMGKTHAFSVPILHKILMAKDADPDAEKNVSAIILVPTKELCKQIEKVIFNFISTEIEWVALNNADVKKDRHDTVIEFLETLE